MNCRKSFLIIIALFMAFSCGARANGLSWDTLWTQKYSGGVIKATVIPGTDRAYGFYNIGQKDTNRWFCEFSDLTGDTIRTICKVNINDIILRPKVMNDTNFIIGEDLDYETRIYDIHTGISSKIRPDSCKYP